MLAMYLIFSSALTLHALLRIPSKMKLVDNVGGSIVLAVAMGWLIWPLALYAARKAGG